MEDIYHKSLENAAAAELTAVLSTETMPRDSIGVSSKTIIMGVGQCSEEHVLKCTFEACDPEQTGKVSVFRIIEYLQEMTGKSCEDWRFQSLYKRLDPEERGITVDFSTFHAVMKDWITDCRQDGFCETLMINGDMKKSYCFGESWLFSEEGRNVSNLREEATDLMNSIQDLQHGNKQLAVQNIKLRRTIETAEDLNSKLSEEIFELKGRLRGSQQALEQARALADELEDLKVFSKSLEEENSKLHTQTRQLEKEQQILCVQVDDMQEKNKKLLLEKESSKCKIKELFTEKAKMQVQLCEYENLISCKDTTLNEKVKQTEELTVALDEYQMVVQELKLEVNRLQDQLCQSYKDLEMLPRDPLENTDTCLQAPAQPLCMEIEETQKQEFGEEVGLPSPLCGMFSSLVTHAVAPGELRALDEELELGKSGADSTKALLQRTCSLFHPSLLMDVKLTLKNEECNQQQQHLPSEMTGRMHASYGTMRPMEHKIRMDEQTQSSLRSGLIGNRMSRMAPKKMWSCLSNKEIQAACATSPEIIAFLSTESSPEEALQDHALVPVRGELIPVGRKRPYDNWFGILIERFFEVLHILQKLVLSGLLVACILLLAIFYFVLPYSQHPIWIEPKGTPSSHFQLRYLQPPPI